MLHTQRQHSGIWGRRIKSSRLAWATEWICNLKHKRKIQYSVKTMAHSGCSMNSSLDYSLITTSKNTAPNVVVSEVLFSHSQASWADTTMARFSCHQLADTLWVLSESKHLYSHMADHLPSRKAKDCGWGHSLTRLTHLDINLRGPPKDHFSVYLVGLLCRALRSIKKERYNPFKFDGQGSGEFDFRHLRHPLPWTTLSCHQLSATIRAIWFLSELSTPRRWRQAEHEFRVILRSISNSRPFWASWGPLS